MQSVIPVGKSLGQLVSEVGFLAPVGGLEEDPPVRGVWIHDSALIADLSRVPEHCLVLGVGIPGDEVYEAGEFYAGAGAAALAVRSSPARVSQSLPVLKVTGGVDWSTLHLVLDTAIHPWGRLGSNVPTGVEGLFSLSEVLAANLQGPVVIHDQDWRMLAYASGGYDIDDMGRRTILNRRAPEDWLATIRDSGGFAVLDAGRVLHVTDGPFGAGLRARALVAIRAGGERLGTLCVIHPSALRTAELERQMVEGAQLAALQIVRSRIVNVATAKAETEALAALIAGEPLSKKSPLLTAVGQATQFMVAAIRPQPENDLGLAVVTERLISMIRTICDAYRLRNVCSVVDKVIYVLVGTDSADARSAVLEIFEGIRRRAHGSGNLVNVALGASVRSLDRFHESLDSVRALLRLLDEGAIAADRVADHQTHELRVEYAQIRSMLRSMSAQNKSSMSLPVGVTSDRQVMETLTSFFGCGGDIHEAARMLDVHPNTVRYRIRKLRDVYGIDVLDPVQRFLVELKVRLLEED